MSKHFLPVAAGCDVPQLGAELGPQLLVSWKQFNSVFYRCPFFFFLLVSTLFVKADGDCGDS